MRYSLIIFIAVIASFALSTVIGNYETKMIDRGVLDEFILFFIFLMTIVIYARTYEK